MKKLTRNIWILFTMVLSASLVITGCATAGGTGQGDSQVQKSAPGQDNIDPRWKARECNWSDMDIDTRKQCWAYVASQLPPLDPNHRELFGEQYDPRKFLKCRNELPRNASCDVYRLRRVENPEYWPYPDVPRPKWPEAPKESVYKPGMSSKEYFEALCKAEAGEFIYKTVENVEGIYQVRPRQEPPDHGNEDRYVLEDPYSYWMRDGQESAQFYSSVSFSYVGKSHYQFFERQLLKAASKEDLLVKGKYYDSSLFEAPGEDQIVERYLGYNERSFESMRKQYDIKPKSRYGYAWRGVSRPHDRELGIAGGELIVVDLQTNEILAIRRNFMRSGYMRNRTGFWWMTAQSCPQITKEVSWKDTIRTVKKENIDFVMSVLKPAIPSK